MATQNSPYPKLRAIGQQRILPGKSALLQISKCLMRLRNQGTCISISRRVTASLAVVAVTTQPAIACAFDMIKPSRTLIDWIVEADTLVLARPNVKNQFVFEITDILSGSEVVDPIDQLVDTSVRRKLDVHREDAVLFAQTNAGQWRRVAYVDSAFREILNTALANRGAWAEEMPQSRIDYIQHLQEASDPRVRTIVIGELDKVPYSQLRTFDLQIPADELISYLWRKEHYPYQAIHALLIGLSGSKDARKVISDFMQRAKHVEETPNLGAFAAAYIELEGEKGISWLANDILNDPSQSLNDVEQIVMAMSVHHALVDSVQQEAINIAIGTLVQNRPSAAAVVARQFSLRSNWSQKATLEGLVKQHELQTANEYWAVLTYLAKAHSPDATPLSMSAAGAHAGKQ